MCAIYEIYLNFSHAVPLKLFKVIIDTFGLTEIMQMSIIFMCWVT